MATLDMVGAALRDTIINAFNSSGVSYPVNQVGLGAPFGPSLSEILGQAEAQVTVYPLETLARNISDRRLTIHPYEQPVVLLAAAISGSNQNVVTFSGTIGPSLNVHTFIGKPLKDIYYGTTTTDTINTLVATIASGINTAAYGLITASASGTILTVYNSPYLKVNIGGVGSMYQEVRRMMVPFQITVWAPDPDSRTTMANIIDSNVGTNAVPFLQAADRAAIRVRLRQPFWRDDSQSSYSLYEAHFIFECEFPTFLIIPSVTIEAVGQTLELQSPSGNILVEPTVITGG